MADQPWIVAEQYDRIVLDGEVIPNPQLIIGPFESQDEAQAYADWVMTVPGSGVQQLAVGQMARIPEAYFDSLKNPSVE